MSTPPARDGDKPHFHGHRERLKKRFHDGGGAALADYELIELILFQSLPRARHQADRQGAAQPLRLASPRC